jgi:hypothetical protein
MLICFVNVGMTPGAIWSIGRKPPVYRLTVGRMTTGTNHTKTVISRVVGGGVIEVDRCPVCGVMAIVTLHGGHKMSGGFPCSCGAIMTRRATSRHQAVIKVCRAPC